MSKLTPYDVDRILVGPREGFIHLDASHISNFCTYALTALDLLVKASTWNRYNFIFNWPDGEGRNLFYYYFKFITDSFIFTSVSDLPEGVAKLPPVDITKDSLKEGPLQNGPALFNYISSYSSDDTNFSELRGAVDSLNFRFKFDRSSRGYYNDKFSRYNKIIGIDLRNVSDTGLESIFEQADRLIYSSTSVRIFCSFYEPFLYDSLLSRYGKRVYSRKKSEDNLRDTMMECAVLSKCDYLLGSSKSEVFNLARVFSNLQTLQ